MLGFLGHVLGHKGPWETLGVMTLGVLGMGWSAGCLCAAGVTGPTPGVLCGRDSVGFQRAPPTSQQSSRKWHELYQLLKQKKTKLYPNHQKMLCLILRFRNWWITHNHGDWHGSPRHLRAPARCLLGRSFPFSVVVCHPSGLALPFWGLPPTAGFQGG